MPLHPHAGSILSCLGILTAGSAAQQSPDTPPASRAEPAGPAHLLRYAFVPGAKGAYRMAVSSTQPVAGQANSIDVAMTFDWEILEITEKGARMRQTVRRIECAMKGGIANSRWDSDNENSDPGMFIGLRDMVNAPFTHLLDDRGRIHDIESPETAGSSGIDYEQLLRHAIPILPDAPVAVGGSWRETKRLTLPDGKPVDFVFENRFASRTGKTVQIDLDLSVADDSADDTQIQNGKGSLTFALDQVLPTSANWRYTLQTKGLKDSEFRFELRRIAAKGAADKR